MSHIVEIRAEIRDVAAIEAACDRLGLPRPIAGNHRLFSGEETGIGVHLPGWKYPVVCRPETGQLSYDNFEGLWGNPLEIDRFLQRYAAETCRIEARKRGHTVTEQVLEDGSLKLTIEVAA